ncbi:shikimate dehydrogenase family protein [Frigoribacterium sp. 2-23]|uniref:shikimate dehydrogenase family protein n=1 Tax=Frigoribacterium sp. 2-23 TaxID=3415006 RepID=UPI003C6EB4CC
MTAARRRRLAVLGSPIAHSLSPELHRTAYELLDLPFDYDRVEVRSGELAAFLDGLDDSWLGLSLTMPLKREVMPLLDDVSDLAARLDVANTLVFGTDGGTDAGAEGGTDGADRGTAVGTSGRPRRQGHNTDVDGIVRTVETWQATRPDAATILGGGATAASALFSAHRLGARRVAVYLRDTSRAGELTGLASALGVELAVRPLGDLATAGPLDFVISTLPGGVADALPLTPASSASVLFDVAYDPWPSRIAEQWQSAGGVVFSGLDMLVEQAIGQIRLFSGHGAELPDEPSVRAAMRERVGLPAVAVS